MSIKIINEIIDIQSNSIDHVRFFIDDKDISIWNLIITNLDKEYKKGEYVCKLILKDYPEKPPEFHCCTPSGRFWINKNICFGFQSSFNKVVWNSKISLRSYIMGVLILFQERSSWDTMGGHLKTKKQDRVKFAKESHEYNMKNHPSLFDNTVLDNGIIG